MSSPSPLENLSIVMLTKYGVRGASSRMRGLQYAPLFEMAGAEVSVEPLFGDAYLNALYGRRQRPFHIVAAAYLKRLAAVLQARRSGLVWVEKEVFPYLPAAFEDLLALSGVRYVVDYDDAVFHNYDMSESRLVRSLLGHKLDRLLRNAALVTAGNDYLREYAVSHGATRTLLLPTVIDLDRYPVTPAPNGDRLRIGWIGTPTTAPYLNAILPAIQAVNAVRPVELVTIGAPPLPSQGFPVEQHAWSQMKEAELLSGVDVGIMPLPDEPFERGKCAYKLIQYMACARPVIASPVGVNAQVVTPEVGYLASSVEEWAAALSRVAADAPLRRRQGLAGRELVERTFSLQAQAPRLIEGLAASLS